MPTILVADDDPDIRELLAFRLHVAGFAVHTADDGEAALAAAQEVQPDLVLLDWMMPRFSGLEVCRELRSRSELAGLPVIMLSAKAHRSDLELGLAAGVDDYITKPFSPREALRRVYEALARSYRAGRPPS
jgi:two-component system phosphate regulon response regulator PhoB